MKISDIIRIDEDVRGNYFYHVCTLRALQGMLVDKSVRVSGEDLEQDDSYPAFGDICLTRDKNYWIDVDRQVRLVISKDAIKQTHKVVPFGRNDFRKPTGRNRYDTDEPYGDSGEERVNKSIPFNKKYIAKVQVTGPLDDNTVS